MAIKSPRLQPYLSSGGSGSNRLAFTKRCTRGQVVLWQQRVRLGGRERTKGAVRALTLERRQEESRVFLHIGGLLQNTG